jgi:pSer/pThr/pTyr-binding forkhead associated (FHA) protein
MEAPVMTFLSGMKGAKSQLSFCTESIRFGKHPDNDICTGGLSTRVSRHHAILTWDGEKWLLKDLNSLYGTYVNAERVEGDAAMLVKSGDKIRIGDIELEVRYEI